MYTKKLATLILPIQPFQKGKNGSQAGIYAFYIYETVVLWWVDDNQVILWGPGKLKDNGIMGCSVNPETVWAKG